MSWGWLVLIAGAVFLGFLLLRAKKKEGASEVRLKSAEEYIESVTKSAREAKENEEATANLTRDMLRQRLQE